METPVRQGLHPNKKTGGCKTQIIIRDHPLGPGKLLGLGSFATEREAAVVKDVANLWRNVLKGVLPAIGWAGLGGM